MARSRWKVPYLNNIFFSNFFLKKNVFFLWKRNALISNFFVNRKFKVHNGKWQLSLVVAPNFVRHKFGEFSITKRMGRDIHLKKNK